MMIPAKRNGLDFFDEVFTDPFFNEKENKIMKTDIKEKDGKYLLEIDVRGYDKEDIKVDAVICDPPYGSTACKWDIIIPFDDMWERLNKLTKPEGAIVLFGNGIFSSNLKISNIKNYKYDWIWIKNIKTNIN